MSGQAISASGGCCLRKLGNAGGVGDRNQLPCVCFSVGFVLIIYYTPYLYTKVHLVHLGVKEGVLEVILA